MSPYGNQNKINPNPTPSAFGTSEQTSRMFPGWRFPKQAASSRAIHKGLWCVSKHAGSKGQSCASNPRISKCNLNEESKTWTPRSQADSKTLRTKPPTEPGTATPEVLQEDHRKPRPCSDPSWPLSLTQLNCAKGTLSLLWACWNFQSSKGKKAIYSLPAFISLPLLGTQHTGKAKFRGTHTQSQDLWTVWEDTDCFTTHDNYMSLHPYGAFPPCCLLLQRRRDPNYTKWDKQHLSCCLYNKANCASICCWKTEKTVLAKQHESSVCYLWKKKTLWKFSWRRLSTEFYESNP